MEIDIRGLSQVDCLRILRHICPDMSRDMCTPYKIDCTILYNESSGEFQIAGIEWCILIDGGRESHNNSVTITGQHARRVLERLFPNLSNEEKQDGESE